MKFSMFPNSSGFRVAVIGAVLLLPACSFTEDALWPSLTGEDPQGESAATQSQPQTAEALAGASSPVA